ncbi:DUF6744 family protein [Limnoglobus roseus]|uniref:Uncharacterized protein n=1 Tax=Limnoglobus roseus TaxID=2598579 RepID=A0A5C1AG26_9BACT|nr:DUF6744 family protein [Limnoglobus roseus]QEL17770.1 hypothetical protein PX52LOC_04776 [Limnoglobus roseus]
MIESCLDTGGAVAFWAACEFTDRDRLRAGLRPLGLDEFVPDPRPPAGVLKDALEEALGGSRVLIRPLADRDGFTVVKEERGRHANAYATALVARVRDAAQATVEYDPFDDRAAAVNAAFRRHAGRIPAAQLSACLVKVVESLGGTRLRPTGAVYWIPGPKLDAWAAVARAVEAASDGRPSAVYVIRHRLDVDAVRAVRDAVVGEVQAATARIAEEVAAGDLGTRALETRRQQAHDLRDKVVLYEELLSVGLADLHRAVDIADQAAATASLLLAAQPPASAVGV